MMMKQERREVSKGSIGNRRPRSRPWKLPWQGRSGFLVGLTVMATTD